MTALEQLIAEGTPHGDIWVGFTPDEEIGAGADLFDLDYFKADFFKTLKPMFILEVMLLTVFSIYTWFTW